MKKEHVLFFLFSILITGVIVMIKIPRGVRNNNPLNIRKGNNWDGESPIPQDTEFETFINPVYGFRAAAKIMINYRDNYGLNTVESIVSRWAPPNENDTSSYVKSVASSVGVLESQTLDFDEHLPKLLSAMAHHENGGDYYNVSMIKKGIALV